MNHENNIPAFPFAYQELDASGMPLHEAHVNYGMTIRDYFASKLAPEIMKQFYEDGTQVKHSDWRQGVAVEAYRIADEMLDFRGQLLGTIAIEELKELSELLARASDLAHDYERDALADKLNTASVRLYNLSKTSEREGT